MEKIWDTVYKNKLSPIRIHIEFTELETTNQNIKEYMEKMFDNKALNLKKDLDILIKRKSDPLNILSKRDSLHCELKLSGPSIYSGIIKKELLETGYKIESETWRYRDHIVSKQNYNEFILEEE